MLHPSQLHDYQKRMVEFQCSHPETAIWADMGLGKTIVTLTSITHLLETKFLKAVLIVAPIRVCRLVWKQESRNWTNTQNLRFSMLMGTRDQRTRGLLKEADVYLINFENLGWLSETLHTYFISKKRDLPFDGIVWDELSKMKNSTTQRVKSVRKILPYMKWKTGLTGTPASNGVGDLHGQFLVLDEGKRLGTSKTAFRTRFYKKVGPFKEVAYDDTETTIKNLIGDMTIEMSAADYLKMPDLIVNDVWVEFDDTTRARYDKMEKEFFIRLDSGAEKEMFNQASLMNSCLQFSNGAIYPVAGMPLWEPIHSLKLDALEDIIEEAAGKPVLCWYQYRSDAARIMERFKDLNPINLTECKSQHSLDVAMHRWKTGDCQLMISHPMCLHPQTKVLTERHGWINLIDVTIDDRVFDGVEFVSHSGCSYSGYADVIDVFGITMTPEHRLLVNNQWREGQYVRDCESSKREALYEYTGNDPSISAMLEMRCVVNDEPSECSEAQSRRVPLLRRVSSGEVPSSNEYPHMENLEGNAGTIQRRERHELWRQRNYGKSRVGEFYKLLSGYEGRVLGRSDHRANRCESTLWIDELPVGDQYGTASQQAEQQSFGVPRGTDTSCRTGETVWILEDDVDHATQSRDEWGRSSGKLQGDTLRKESVYGEHSAERKTHVYDLVDCGPRHQFLIRNDDGEMFISHNSAGHGIDGLQKAGHTMVWMGATWSLDSYDQAVARLHRQGQGQPVICHRILTKDTLDQAQVDALNSKAADQTALRKAVSDYRKNKSKTT